METIKVSKQKLTLVTIGCFMLMVSSSVVSNSQSYFLTTVRDYLGCTAAQFSLYYSFVQMCTVLTSLCIGIIMSKVPTRVYLAVGAVGTALGFIILSRTTALWMVYAGAICVGLFQALIVVPVVQILNSWMPEGSGSSMGIVMSATGVGGIVMAQVMPRVVANISWRTGYMLCAVLYIIFTVVGIILAGEESPYSKAEKAAEQSGAKKKSNFGVVAKNPMFWVFIAVCFIGNGVCNIDQHLVPIMQTKGWETAMLATGMTVFNVSLVIFKVGHGVMYQKTGGKRYILFYGIVSILGFLLLRLQGPALFVGIVAKAFMGAGITVLYSLICNEYFGTRFGGAVWGFSWASFQFGATVFSPIYGSFLDRYGNYDRSLYIGAVATVLVSLVFFYMLSHKSQEANEEMKA